MYKRQQLDDAVEGLDMVAAMLHVEGRVLPMAAVPLVIEADVVGACLLYTSPCSLRFNILGACCRGGL